MTGFIWGFILGLLVSSFGVFLTLALAYVGARADADDLDDWRKLGTEEDWVWSVRGAQPRCGAGRSYAPASTTSPVRPDRGLLSVGIYGVAVARMPGSAASVLGVLGSAA